MPADLFVDRPLDEREVQRLLVGEVVIELALAHPSGREDPVERRRVVAVLAELIERRADERGSVLEVGPKRHGSVKGEPGSVSQPVSTRHARSRFPI